MGRSRRVGGVRAHVTKSVRRPVKLLRLKDLSDLSGLDRVAIWRLRRDGLVPEPDTYVGKRPAWYESTMNDCLSTIPRFRESEAWKQWRTPELP